MKLDDLFLTENIFNSDDDSEVVDDIYAGYDEAFNLVILMEYTNYDESEFNCCAYAVVGKEEAFKLAKEFCVPMTSLTEVIKGAVKPYRRLVNPTLSQTRNCFSDILKFLTDNGCKLTLHRTYGADGYTCY